MEIQGTNGSAPHMLERLGDELPRPGLRARRSATSTIKHEAIEDYLGLVGPQERTRRLIMAAVRLWEIRRGLTG